MDKIRQMSNNALQIQLQLSLFVGREILQYWMAHRDIPIVDISYFFKEFDENGKKKAMEVIQQACCEHGAFQIVNHGVPVDLMKRVLELSGTFFGYSDEEKLKCSGGSRASLPVGYGRSSQKLPDKYEYLLMLSPCSSNNLYPKNPPEFRYLALLFVIKYEFKLN